MPGRKVKIARQWCGPYVIIEKVSDIVFIIKFSKNARPITGQGDNLKPYSGDKKFTWFTAPGAATTGNADQMEFPTLTDYIINQDSACETRGNSKEMCQTPAIGPEQTVNENQIICQTTPNSFPETPARVRSSVSRDPRPAQDTCA